MKHFAVSIFLVGCSFETHPPVLGDCTENCDSWKGSGGSSGLDTCYTPFIGVPRNADIDAGVMSVFAKLNDGGSDGSNNDGGIDGSYDGSSDSGASVGEAGPCNIACDPYCNYYQSPNSTTDTSTYVGAGIPLSSAPSGWAKQIYTPCNPSSQVGCEFDSYCLNGTCTLYSPSQENSSAGVDLTAQSACYNSDGSATFPLCNRGQKDATSGLVNVGFDQNPSPSVCSPVPAPYPSKGVCVVDFSKTPLKAGQCIDLNPSKMQNLVSCSGVNVSGNRDWFPNFDGLFSETNLCNNEGYLKSGQTCSTLYEPQSYTQVYIPQCPSGTIPQWKSFDYSVNTSTSGTSSSQVQFSAQLAMIGDDGGLGVWGNSFSLATIPTMPNNCTLTGPSPQCPINLTTIFGANTSEQSALLLTIILTPSKDGLASSSVNGDQVLYDCVPAT